MADHTAQLKQLVALQALSAPQPTANPELLQLATHLLGLQQQQRESQQMDAFRQSQLAQQGQENQGLMDWRNASLDQEKQHWQDEAGMQQQQRHQQLQASMYESMLRNGMPGQPNPVADAYGALIDPPLGQVIQQHTQQVNRQQFDQQSNLLKGLSPDMQQMQVSKLAVSPEVRQQLFDFIKAQNSSQGTSSLPGATTGLMPVPQIAAQEKGPQPSAPNPIAAPPSAEPPRRMIQNYDEHGNPTNQYPAPEPDWSGVKNIWNWLNRPLSKPQQPAAGNNSTFGLNQLQ